MKRQKNSVSLGWPRDSYGYEVISFLASTDESVRRNLFFAAWSSQCTVIVLNPYRRLCCGAQAEQKALSITVVVQL